MGTILDAILERGLTAFGNIQFQVQPPKVTAADCRAVMAKAQTGMVICRKYNYYLDGHFIPGEYTHSGIVESPNMVIHAVAEGVGRIDILDFVKDADGFILLEFARDYFNPEECVKYAIEQIGLPYDFHFNDELGKPITAFFCHKLTAKALAAGGIKIAPVLKKVGLLTHEVFVADQFVEDKRVKVVYKS